MNAKIALESLGHTLVPFQMPDMDLAARLEFKLLCADMGKNFVEDLKYDQLSHLMEPLHRVSSMPMWKRKLLTSIPFLKTRYEHLTYALETRLSSDLWDAMADRESIIREILTNMHTLDLDLILCPVFPYVAPAIEDAGNIDQVGK